ncbi:MAG: DUF2007 domain-containing protein [Myxococcota bacterium]
MSPLTPFYHAAHAVEAERIVSLLHEQGIQADYHEQQLSQLPGVETVGQHRVSVATPDHERASRIINNAREDGIISRQGQFARER